MDPFVANTHSFIHPKLNDFKYCPLTLIILFANSSMG